MTKQDATHTSKPCDACECDPCDCDWGLYESVNQDQKHPKRTDKKKNR